MGDGILDAARISAAANTLTPDPERWRAWAPHANALAHIRRIWHVVVYYGRPARPL
jgi:hypothetical protein